jgi:hypothetical protein
MDGLKAGGLAGCAGFRADLAVALSSVGFARAARRRGWPCTPARAQAGRADGPRLGAAQSLLIALNTMSSKWYFAELSTGAGPQLQEILKLQSLITDFYKVSKGKGTTNSAQKGTTNSAQKGTTNSAWITS